MGTVYQFDGCPRFGYATMPDVLENQGEMTYQQCAELCMENGTDCIGFEINGCASDKDCTGDCWTFAGDATRLTNGKCRMDGSQKTYLKASATPLTLLQSDSTTK